MTDEERTELVDWMHWAFEGLVTGSLWDDLTPRSRGNVFDWRDV